MAYQGHTAVAVAAHKAAAGALDALLSPRQGEFREAWGPAQGTSRVLWQHAIRGLVWHCAGGKMWVELKVPAPPPPSDPLTDP